MQGSAPARTAALRHDARTVGHDAAQAIRGVAGAAADIARDHGAPVSVRIGDAAQLAGEATDTARGLAADAAGLAQRARQLAADGPQAFEAYVRARPLQAALYAAAFGAVAAELLLRALRRGRRR